MRYTLHRLPHKVILFFLHALTDRATRHARATIGLTVAISFALLAGGWFSSNFVFVASETELWRPIGSMVDRDGAWLDNLDQNKYYRYTTSNDEQSRRLSDRSPQENRRTESATTINEWLTTTVIMHKNGGNVVNMEGAERLFQIQELVTSTPGYQEFCQQYGQHPECPPGLERVCAFYNISSAQTTCQRVGPTVFFLNSVDVYRSRVKTDGDLQQAMSPATYLKSFSLEPTEVDTFLEDVLQGYQLHHMIGYPEFQDGCTSLDTAILASGKSFTMLFVIPGIDRGWQLALDLESRLLELRDQWHLDNSTYGLELTSALTFESEISRGLEEDLPFVGLTFCIISIFTMLAFCRVQRHAGESANGRVMYSLDSVQSRSTLGLGAVVCVLLSIISGYGLLFFLHVPFTPITPLLSFLLFSIGVDDAFVLLAAYERTDSLEPVSTRVHRTIEDVGVSVFMTSATSITAFCLGSFSTIPAVRWLCLYAIPMIAIDLVYQCTFFIALLTMDDERIKDERKDFFCRCCFCGACIPAVNATRREEEEDSCTQVDGRTKDEEPDDVTDSDLRFCWQYILSPVVQAVVLILSAVSVIASAFAVSNMAVDFDFTSVLPQDSFIIDFYKALNNFGQDASIAPSVNFRFEDQSLPQVRQAMENYVHDLVEEVGGISTEPASFWVKDFHTFLQSFNNTDYTALPFNVSFRLFLDEPAYSRYWNDVVLDDDGDILSSKARIFLDNMDHTDVDQYLRAFRDIRDVGRAQTVNAETEEWSFFVFEPIFFLWAFLDTTLKEMVTTILIGVGAVATMTALIVPNLAAVMFVTPVTAVAFLNLLGFLTMFGVDINGLSYIAVVLSIGLLSDYIMHVVLRYFESPADRREQKTRDALCSMGSSVLLGATSTFLGTLSLAFTSTAIFQTIFVVFCGIVIVGITHGLLLLPVILALLGPE